MREQKLVEGRERRARHRRGGPTSLGRWRLVGAGAAVVSLAALASASVFNGPATGRYDAAGATAVDPFIDDEVLDEFVAPEQLDAVPVGPGAVAKPVAMVLAGAPVIKTLGESGIPEVAVRAYKQAEARLAAKDPGCGIPWTLLAAIGRVESNHGRFGGAQLRDDGSATRRIRGIPLDGRPNVALIRDTDGGALDGDTVYDRAVGSMQFIPSTWRSIQADANGDGFADPNNIFDAAQGAAQYLCNAASNLRDPSQAAKAVRRYNNADSYVRVVLGLARMYAAGRVIGLPSTGDLLPGEPVGQSAVRRWPNGQSAVPPWSSDSTPAQPWWSEQTPVQPWSSEQEPDGTVLAKPAPPQRTKPAAPPSATSPRTTVPPQSRPNPTNPRPTKPVVPAPATTTAPPAAQPSQPPPTTKPIPATPEPTQTLRPEQPRPSDEPVPTTHPSSPKPQPTQTRPRRPRPTEPKSSEPEPTQLPTSKPSEPRPSEPKSSEPKSSEPKSSEPKSSEPNQSTPRSSEPNTSDPKPSARSESGSRTPTPSAEPTAGQQPTTAAVGWAPAMRKVVGETLARAACPQPDKPQPAQPGDPKPKDHHGKACSNDSEKPSPARQNKHPESARPAR